MTRKERYQQVIAYFRKYMPVAETELLHGNPYELMVAVILSAQCTDKRVNLITPGLLAKYPTISTLAAAPVDEVFAFIKSCSYPNNKAKHLVGMAKMVMEKYKGQVPESFEDLLRLPGVGRKTANVISAVAFGRPAMPVDTHVFRVSGRIGLTYRARTPYDAEKQLVKYFPEALLPLAHHWLILHGRYVCLARKPKCHLCGLKAFCRYYSRSGSGQGGLRGTENGEV